MTSFSHAFAAARKAGKKTFNWQGKSYNTKLAPATKAAKTTKTAKNIPVPTPRPEKKQRERADYPMPDTGWGIARKGSILGKAKARMNNTPVASTKKSGRALQGLQTIAGAKERANKAASVQGPIPEGVWYARKGSAISRGAARRANKPVPSY